jgi:hypothetical protein
MASAVNVAGATKLREYSQQLTEMGTQCCAPRRCLRLHSAAARENISIRERQVEYFSR